MGLRRRGVEVGFRQRLNQLSYTPAELAGEELRAGRGGFSADLQQNWKLLLCLLQFLFCSFQGVNFLLKDWKLVFKNRRLLHQLVIEFFEFSNCFGFTTAGG